MQRLRDTSGKGLKDRLKDRIKGHFRGHLMGHLKGPLKGRLDAFLEKASAGRRIPRAFGIPRAFDILQARLRNLSRAPGERWRRCRPKPRVGLNSPWALHPLVSRSLVPCGVALCLVFVVLKGKDDLTHPGPDVFVKNPKRAQASGETAGKGSGIFDGWYRFPVESWQLASVKPDIGSLERKGSSLGYSCVREPVGTVAGWPRIPAPLLAAGENWEIVAWVPENLAEPLDARGRPLRWGANADAFNAHVGLEMRQSQRPSPSYYYVSRARGLGYKGPILHHEPAVRKFASMYKLPPHLIFAVMQVESGGRQELVSHRDARGLMQVQPSTAGSEVARYLASRAGEGESTSHNVHAALADANQNILYGTSYLHILDKVYFRNVTDKESRLLCVLAAYNMGPGRLLRLFGPTPEESVAHINSYSPMGLYEEIKARFEEVPDYDYMDKVITLMLQYRKMGY